MSASERRDVDVGAGLGDLAGKYMSFELGGEIYAVDILQVREIIEVLEITRVPRAPAHVLGVINLRGRVISVVDLRRRFAMPAKEPTAQSVIIVLQLELDGRSLTLGVLVDQVLEVLDVQAGQCELPPDVVEVGAAGEFIRGIAKIDASVVFLLDAACCLTGADALERDEPPESLTPPHKQAPAQVQA